MGFNVEGESPYITEHIKIYSLPIAPSGILFDKHGSGTVDRRPSMEIKIYTHDGKLFHDNWIHVKCYFYK